MTAKKWFKNCILFLLLLLIGCAALVAWLDPFFHYHAPLEGFYYVLDEQRMQNDGITKHFSYDAVITGTSMTENFRTSELDALFGVQSIKVPYAGATYKELNDNLEVAFSTHGDIRMVVRGLDMTMLLTDADTLREDMGDYPVYLTNDNPLDDVKYLLNKDAIGRYCGVMLLRRLQKKAGGVTTFDAYSFTGDDTAYGAGSALEWRFSFDKEREAQPLTKTEEETARQNVRQNVCALAAAHPETDFYYFIPPYSMVYWGREKEQGALQRDLKLRRLLLEEMLPYENIRVFDFALMTDITTDLSRYRDSGHYSPEVNTLLLSCMKEDKGRVTAQTLDAHLGALETLVYTYDYDSLLKQAKTDE